MAYRHQQDRWTSAAALFCFLLAAALSAATPAAVLGAPLGAPGGDDPKDPDPSARCPVNPACTLTAQPITDAITIDGLLDEGDWQLAAVASGFKQFEPNEGAAPSQKTEVRILYGGNAVYVGALLYDDAPDQIMRALGRRDEINQADWFLVAIDSYFDRKTAYAFGVNAAGVQVDGIVTRDMDESWDAVWDSAVRITDEGWVVEMRIPYSMLRFSEAAHQQWGINFRRVIPRLGETDEWVLVPRSELFGGMVSRYGILDGLNNISPRRNVQVTPYTVSQILTEEGDPGRLQSTRNIDIGGDVKIGLSSNVTLDATLNPDFGQVDADPAELNLTAFESFFPERRPFFTEGVQIFNFSLDRGSSLLYTRRIGGASPIIGATKLSGRTGRGLSFGVLGAATGTNFNPSRLYSVARLEQRIGSLSSVGGMLTAFEALDERRSFVGGLDWDLRLQDNKYLIDGQASFTSRMQPGTGEAAERGFSASLGVDKIKGITNIFSGVTLMSDGFNPNDLGRLRRNNFISAGMGFRHQVNGGDAFGPFRRGSVFAHGSNDFSYSDLDDLGFGIFASTDWETKGFQEIDLGLRADYLFGGVDIYESRGLGPRAQPREFSIDASISTDARRTWQLEPGIDFDFVADGGRGLSVGLDAEWTVSSRVNLSADIGFGGDQGMTAWASNQAFARGNGGWEIAEASGAPDAESIFRRFEDGNVLDALFAGMDAYDEQGRYFAAIYGERDTRTFDFTLRSDLTLTPTLSIQFYGQLFAARGQYHNFSVLQDAESLTALPSYPKTHDFGFSSFQSNTVLRWEYRPGSTLYVVWQQSRGGGDDLDVFDLTSRSPFNQQLSNQLADTFDVFPTNVFLLKFSYKFLR